MTEQKIICAERTITLGSPVVMGILNMTPDSFSDGGQYLYTSTDGVKINQSAVCQAIDTMQKEGATIIDIGGESTRPGSIPVSEQEELDRVLPVIEWVKNHSDLIISIDTSRACLIKNAARLGAHMINDVRALTQPDALHEFSNTQLAICLMHMQGEPNTMQEAPYYDHVVHEVYEFLRQRINACTEKGVADNRIVIDPGIGFGKTLAHNSALINQLKSFTTLKTPLLVGVSRKRFIGEILNIPVKERLAGSIGAALYAYSQVGAIIRTHDVKATVEALTVFHRLRKAH